jgi:hypothetical protein
MKPGLVGSSLRRRVCRPQSSHGSVCLGIERRDRITNKTLKASKLVTVRRGRERSRVEGARRRRRGIRSGNPQGLKTQEGIGLLAEVTPLLVVTDCCPAQGLEGGAEQAGAGGFGREQGCFEKHHEGMAVSMRCSGLAAGKTLGG